MSQGEVMESDALLAKANNDLAVRLHQQLAKKEGNVFFSPFSISAAMSMLFRGTKAATAEEMSRVLGFDSANMSPESVHQSFSKLMTILSKDQESYILAVANGIVSSKTYPFLEEYIQDLKLRYKAEAWEVDFLLEAQKAVGDINGWVEEKTRGLIPSLLDNLDPATVMVLLNAIYFKGTWKDQFDPRSTYPRPFFNKGVSSETKMVPMMSMEKRFPFTENPSYKALELPYKGDDVSMLILLPQATDGRKELEESLNADFVQTIRKDMWETTVSVSLPKFGLQYTKELKDTFQSLGLQSVFEKGANFKGMSDSDDLVVSNIVHKAVIEVNEEGSEAAAATAVVMMAMCIRQVPEFIADHPFLFLIFDKRNGMILFMGRVEEL